MALENHITLDKYLQNQMVSQNLEREPFLRRNTKSKETRSQVEKDSERSCKSFEEQRAVKKPRNKKIEETEGTPN
jgi:hypothetical protein